MLGLQRHVYAALSLCVHLEEAPLHHPSRWFPDGVQYRHSEQRFGSLVLELGPGIVQLHEDHLGVLLIRLPRRLDDNEGLVRSARTPCCVLMFSSSCS